MACALLPLASFALYAFEEVSHQLARQAAGRLEAASKDAGMGLLERLLLLDAELRSVATHLREPASAGIPAGRLETLEERFAALWEVGAGGEPTRRVLGEARSIRPLAPDERQRLRSYGALLRTVPSAQGERTVLLLRAVADDLAGRGLLVGRPHPEFLWRLVEGAGQQGVTVLDAEGRVLTSSLPPSAHPPAAETSSRGRLLEWSAGGESQVGASWTLFLASRFGSPPWTVVRSEPRSWVFEPVQGFERSFVLVAALALAGVALLSHAWIRRTLRPLEALRDAALRLGERDVSARVPVAGNDELADVGRAFNHMAHDLEEHLGALDRLIRIDQEILSSADASELAATVAARALPLCGAEAALVASTAAGGEGEVEVYVATTSDEEAWRAGDLAALPESASGEVADVDLAGSDGDAFGVLARLGMRHARLVPIRRGRSRLGVLAVARSERPFGAGEPAAYLQQLADQAAAALAHLHEQERSRVLAFYDTLTGLPNRPMFQERLQQAVARGRGERSSAVCILRMEGFRRIHETFGRATADALLQRIVERLRGVNRAGDLFRFEGSELAILLWDLESPDGAARVAQYLLDAFRQPFRTSEGEVAVSAHVGVSLHPQDGERAELLERNARAALQSASEEGPGHYRFYSPEMSERSRERLALEADLRHAIDRGELDLALHPILAVDTREIVGAEALVRWSRDGEPVSPARFIPIAEEAGLVGEIGEWVLRRACGLLAEWLAEGLPPIQLHVNVSAHQLHDDRLYGLVRSLLRETGLPRGLLDLEITESAVTDHGDATCERLRRIRALGVGLSIDDFGKGYSSLTQLRSLSVDTLKIDRSFIDRVHEEPADAAVARTIIAMAHSLGLTVVAEGVEREEHLAFLREEGCDDAQGFLFAKPMPPDAFRKHLREAAERGAVRGADELEGRGTRRFAGADATAFRGRSDAPN